MRKTVLPFLSICEQEYMDAEYQFHNIAQNLTVV